MVTPHLIRLFILGTEGCVLLQNQVLTRTPLVSALTVENISETPESSALP